MLTLAVVDADRFKSLNDTHGHAAGDIVLKKISRLLRESFRQSDTVGRYGGGGGVGPLAGKSLWCCCRRRTLKPPCGKSSPCESWWRIHRWRLVRTGKLCR